MAARGLCSRREADAFIQKGWVFVDNVKITVLGTKISPCQTITLSPAAQAHSQQLMTILLNKPIEFVSGQPEKGYKHALSLITPDRCHHPLTNINTSSFPIKYLAPAGRLDIDSQGLLVYTQDGRIARQLIGADSPIEKEYLVRVTGIITPGILNRLRHGLSLDGKKLKPAVITQRHANLLQFILHEGRKRQIRRMCEKIDLQVTGLKRVRIGRIVLGGLPVGKWRQLAPHERF